MSPPRSIAVKVVGPAERGQFAVDPIVGGIFAMRPAFAACRTGLKG